MRLLNVSPLTRSPGPVLALLNATPQPLAAVEPGARGSLLDVAISPETVSGEQPGPALAPVSVSADAATRSSFLAAFHADRWPLALTDWFTRCHRPWREHVSYP